MDAMRRLLVCAAAGAFAVAGCASHHAAHGPASSDHASTAVPTGTPGFVLIANRSTVVSAGPPAHLSSATTKAAEALVRDYVVRGTVDVLRSGRLGRGFSDLFGSGAVAAIAKPGNDRSTVTDLGVARAAGSVRVRATMHLTGLGDGNGNIVMLSASFKAATRSGPVAIDRAGELLLGRGAGGHWTIIGYNLRAQRKVGTAPATTTTARTSPAAPATAPAPATTGAKP